MAKKTSRCGNARRRSSRSPWTGPGSSTSTCPLIGYEQTLTGPLSCAGNCAPRRRPMRGTTICSSLPASTRKRTATRVDTSNDVCGDRVRLQPMQTPAISGLAGLGWVGSGVGEAVSERWAPAQVAAFHRGLCGHRGADTDLDAVRVVSHVPGLRGELVALTILSPNRGRRSPASPEHPCRFKAWV
jgi:hypothetical protein